MGLRRRTFLQGAAVTSILAVTGLSAGRASGTPSSSGVSLAFDHTAWNHDVTNDVYWQLGRSSVSRPAAEEYETLAVFVPGAYLRGTKNSDGTYTATVDPSGTVAGFTARTAPIVFPVNTPGYAAQSAIMGASGDSALYRPY